MSTYWLVEPHNSSNATLLEIATIVIWREGLEAIVDSSDVGGTRESQQLACMPQQRQLTGIHAAVLTLWVSKYQMCHYITQYNTVA